jgi:hypothetical protein
MNLNDPEYAPIYYKVMVMDRSGTAEKCVKPPSTDRGESVHMRPLSRTGAPKTEGLANPVAFPNNVPLGGGGQAGGGGDSVSCYGCLGDSH